MAPAALTAIDAAMTALSAAVTSAFVESSSTAFTAVCAAVIFILTSARPAIAGPGAVGSSVVLLLPPHAASPMVSATAMTKRASGVNIIGIRRCLNDRGVLLPVVIIAGHGDITMAVRTMRAAAADSLETPVSRDRLSESVARAVDTGRSARPDPQQRSDIGGRLGALTTPERQVLEPLVMGRTSRVVAHERGTGARTLEVSRRNVMAQMGAGRLSHLARMTFVAGIAPSGGESVRTRGAT